MNVIRINLILWLMFVVTWPLLAEEAEHEIVAEAVLSIHISNGTAGGRVLEGTPVTVNFYHGDHIAKQAQAVTDVDGNCMIQGIPAGSDIVAVAQAKHSNMAFSSAPLDLQPGQKQYDLSFQVFDVSDDNSLIQAGTHHLIIKKSGPNVQFTEYIQLINDSDKAVSSDQKDENENPKVIEIALPENVENLSFSSYFHSDAIAQTITGFYDTMAIPPGSYHAVFSYNVPLSTEAIDFTKIITLPTQSMMVFVQSDTGITSEFGEPAGQMALKDGTPTNYYSVAVSPGSALVFHVEGISVPPGQQNTWIMLGIVFAVVAVIGLVRLIKHQPKD
ncbi:MAG: hypothetical protein OEV87_11450 [Phycisphaerae bacterium]|nr:hypothetical protein [Phycisphaerae bacterium]